MSIVKKLHELEEDLKNQTITKVNLLSEEPYIETENGYTIWIDKETFKHYI